MTSYQSSSLHSPPPPHALQPSVSFCVCCLRLHLLTWHGPPSMLAAADFTVPTSLINTASSHARPPRTEQRSLEADLRTNLCHALQLLFRAEAHPPFTILLPPGSLHTCHPRNYQSRRLGPQCQNPDSRPGFTILPTTREHFNASGLYSQTGFCASHSGDSCSLQAPNCIL